MRTVIIIILLFSSICSAQYAFSEFNTSRYARTIALGNSFTGLADDIEAVYYNSAGLANLDNYSLIYSNGQGFAFIVDDYKSFNIAVLIPSFEKIGKFALSVDNFSYADYDISYNIYRLHYARNIFTNFSLGVSINYYRFYSDRPPALEMPVENLSAGSLDLSLSALFTFSPEITGYFTNKFGVGLQLQNLLDTDLFFAEDMPDQSKHQILRLGLSASIIPEFQKVYGFTPVKLILLSDATFYGAKYEFKLLQPNYGLELQVFEILSLRYGRENEIEIENVYEYSPQHPVSRFGIGINLPVHRMISIDNKIEIVFDYSYSDWDKIDETKPIIMFFSDVKAVRDAYSLKVNFGL